MGLEINKTDFSGHEYRTFSEKLEQNLAALKLLLARLDFGMGSASLGAELELCLIDADGCPAYNNEELITRVDDPQLTYELNQYNLEYNLTPLPLNGMPLTGLEQQILDKLSLLRNHARHLDSGAGNSIVPIGILPTLQLSDFGSHAISKRKRYRALLKVIGGVHPEFHIDINGIDPLKLTMHDISLEAATTSFQLHYPSSPAEFATLFNAFSLVTPLVLAICGNSPSLFAHKLWQETRIPVFKQSVDMRKKHRYQWHQTPRVTFGNGWVRDGAYELFAEAVHLYPALIPICDDENPMQVICAGGIPKLSELRLQQGTLWWWNRPIYDDADGGHLRIELRSLPAGPTAVDMVANAALYIGLTEGIKQQLDELLPAMPFELARYNFYRSAQHGLDAKLVWPQQTHGYRLAEVSARQLLAQYMDTASLGLERIGVDNQQAQHYLNVIQDRLQTGQTGAVWQMHKLDALELKHSRQKALQQMLRDYLTQSISNTPVANWQ